MNSTRDENGEGIWETRSTWNAIAVIEIIKRNYKQEKKVKTGKQEQK